MPLHLLFNLYALWLTGPFVERLYGRVAFVVLYVLFAAGGSLGTFAFGSAQYGVGASGAIFGLFGLMFAVQVVHRPLLDRQARAFMGQMGGLIAFNLLLGFMLSGTVDNWAHIGGLVSGLWVGLLFAPSRIPTMRSLWMRPGAAPGTMVPAFGAGGMRTIRVVGLMGLAVFYLFLWTLGAAAWG
jgi:rhomboid protease GluP